MTVLRQIGAAFVALLSNLAYFFNVAAHARETGARLTAAEIRVAQLEVTLEMQERLSSEDTRQMRMLERRLDRALEQQGFFRKVIADIAQRAELAVEQSDPAGRFKKQFIQGVRESCKIALARPGEVLTARGEAAEPAAYNVRETKIDGLTDGGELIRHRIEPIGSATADEGTFPRTDEPPPSATDAQPAA